MADLDAASLDDVRHFFETYYTPDNAVLTVAGDFDRSQTRTWIEKHFGGIKPGKGRPPIPDPGMPKIFGEWKREVVLDNVMLPRLFLAFLSPVFGTEEFYAASVCAAILGLRKGSRLYKSLVRERQVAAETQAFTYDLTKGSDVFVVDVTGLPTVTGEQLEHEVAREIDLLHANGVTPDEVARAITLIQTDYIATLQSAGERADRLSMFATYFGDPGLINAQVERYGAVTVDAVNAFVRERLGENNRASLLYVPRPPRRASRRSAHVAETTA
jgi:predicted Zn-dependent peptidase